MLLWLLDPHSPLWPFPKHLQPLVDPHSHAQHSMAAAAPHWAPLHAFICAHRLSPTLALTNQQEAR